MTILVTTPVTTLPIQERFVSIQGEGALVGVPSTFLRVRGCNLRCAWCDSPATSWEPVGEPVPIDALVEGCRGGPRHVVLTGGEPLLFAASAALSQRLRAAGHHLTVETAGTVWVDGLVCDLASISPKLSHSTPSARDPRWARRHDARRRNLGVLRRLIDAFPWQLKFVVEVTAVARDLARDLEEIDELLAALEIPAEDHHRVLLMPQTVDPKALEGHYRELVDACVSRGFRLGQRLHLSLFGHTPGT